MAEQGEARSHGNGHDSVDQGAFLFYARRDLITLDPGYGGFSQVEKINLAEHHSMILVDGKGPRPAYKWLRYGPWRPSREDARIVRGPRTGESGSVRSVEVETAYQGAKIDRTMVLVGDRYLLVEDRCQSGRTRDFTTLIHANAGAQKDRPLRVNGTNVTYQTNLKKVEVAVGAAATAPLRVETTRRFDATGERPAGHESIDYTASGRTVRFLSAIATGSPRGKAPRVGAVSVGGGAIALRVEVDGRIDIVVSNPGRRTIQVPATRGTSAFSTKQALSIRAFTGSGVAGKRVWDVK
jgi:hypothetical protein